MTRIDADVVIIGSGIGGLCAGALLARAGYETVVLERMPVFGGRYTSVKYKGFTVPTASWMLLYGKDDPVYHTLQEVGASEIEMRSAGTPVARYRINGKIYDWPEKGALRYLLSLACDDPDEVRRVLDALGQAMSQIPSNSITFRDWLLQYTANEAIHNIFQAQIATWCGMNAHELPSGEFIRALLSFRGKSEFLIPQNGLSDIVVALEESIRNNGGRLFDMATVKRIVIEDGVASMVIAERDGRLEVGAVVVISDAGPKRTIELAGEDNFSPAYREDVTRRMRPAVGMDYLFSTDEPLLDFPGTLYTTDTRSKASWSVPTLMWPEHAPKGKHLLHGFAVPRSTQGYDPEVEYDIFMQDLADVFPDFTRSGGQLLLRRNFCGEWPCTRAWQGYDVGQETPIENLYNVGDGVKPEGRIVGSGAAQSGRIVAEMIINKKCAGK